MIYCYRVQPVAFIEMETAFRHMKRRLNTCASVALLYAAVCCAAPLEPARGVFVGATVDFNVYSPESFNATTEFAHAFVLVFSSFPPNYSDLEYSEPLIAETSATLELVLQSDVTGWDARGPPHGDDNVTQNHSDHNVTQW